MGNWNWAIEPRGKSKNKIWLGTFFGSVLTIFISFSGSETVFSRLVIDIADSYMLQQFHNCFHVSVKLNRGLIIIFTTFPLHSLAQKYNREKIHIFFPEMMKACPLINNLEKKNSRGSVFGLFLALLKVAQNVDATAAGSGSCFSIIILAS